MTFRVRMSGTRVQREVPHRNAQQCAQNSLFWPCSSECCDWETLLRVNLTSLLVVLETAADVGTQELQLGCGTRSLFGRRRCVHRPPVPQRSEALALGCLGHQTMTGAYLTTWPVQIKHKVTQAARTMRAQPAPRTGEDVDSTGLERRCTEVPLLRGWNVGRRRVSPLSEDTTLVVSCVLDVAERARPASSTLLPRQWRVADPERGWLAETLRVKRLSSGL